MNATTNPGSHPDSRPALGPTRQGPLRSGLASALLLGLLTASGAVFGGNIINQYPGTGSPSTGWPTTWTASNILDDNAGDGTTTGNSWRDFVGNSSYPGFYTARIGNYLFFRIRVNYSGTSNPFSGGSMFFPIQNVTGLFHPASPQYAISWDMQTGHGMELQVWRKGGCTNVLLPVCAAWDSSGMQDADGNSGSKLGPDFDTCGRSGDGYIRTEDQAPGNTTFVDFAISCTYLNAASQFPAGWSCSNSGAKSVSLHCGEHWYVQAASNDNGNDHSDFQFDVAGGVSQIDQGILGHPAVSDPLKGWIGTYALLENSGASVHDGQVVVEWTTQTEVGTLGFDLERLSSMGEFERVNEERISGSSVTGLGGTYRFVDPSALPGFTYIYRLTEIEASGTRREVGQYAVTPEQRTETAQTSRMQPFPGEAAFTPRMPNADEQARLAARRAERAERVQIPTTEVSAAAKTVAKAAIGVEQTGLHFVPAAELDRVLGWPAGKAANLIQTQRLRLTNQGEAIAWLAAPDAQGFYFYGEASDSIYDRQNVYVAQQGRGRVMGESKVRASGAAGAASFAATVTAVERRFPATVFAKDPEEDYWFWTYFKAGGTACKTEFSGCASRDFAIEAPAAAATGPAQLTLRLRGASSFPAYPDHQVAVTVNGTSVGEGQWDGLTDLDLVLPFDGSLLKAGTNTVRLQALPSDNEFYLGRIDLTYQRVYRADQERLLASGTANRVLSAGGFVSDAIRVLDLTVPARPKTVTGAKIQGTPGNYGIEFVPSGNAKPYLMLTPSAVSAPSSIRAMQTTGLAGRKPGARYLVIAPEEFADAARRLIDFRAQQGLSGNFVPLQGVYDDYGGGRKSPHAVREFLQNASRNWREKPAYIVLGGKGTLDPKDYLGYGTDRLPVLMTLTSAGLVATDQRFVDTDGSGVGRIPIGRLPAVTAAEFAAMVDKTITYENSAASRPRRIVLAADSPDDSGNYTADSETAAAWAVQAGYSDAELQRLYLEKMPAADARAALLAGLQQGTGLFNYFGHAGVLALDHGLLTANDVAALNNKDRLPVMVGLTCFMSRFELPQFTSLAERLLLHPNGGAVGIWSSGGMSYSSLGQTGVLGSAFFQALLEKGESRIGDAVVRAISDYVSAGDAPDVPKIYNFLGDPAVTSTVH